MKIVKCPECGREREVKDDVVIKICPGCQVAMEDYDD